MPHIHWVARGTGTPKDRDEVMNLVTTFDRFELRESKHFFFDPPASPSRLLTSSLSLGVPVPRATQCMRGA